jgi:hypothetical protein
MCVGADVIFVDAIRPSSGIQRSIVSLAAAQQQPSSSRKEIKSKQQHAAGSIPSIQQHIQMMLPSATTRDTQRDESQ